MKNNKNISKLILSDMQKEILVGLLLGPAQIEFKKGHINPQVVVEIKIDVNIGCIEYVEDIFMKFENWVVSPPFIDRSIFYRPSIMLCTYRHAVFLKYHKLFYEVYTGSYMNLKKFSHCVPKNISELLTPIGLAYWFMSHGQTFVKQKIYGLNTINFNINDHYLLRDVLYFKFKIKSIIFCEAKELYCLYIAPESVNDFTDLIEPYILDCVKYKLIMK